VVVHAGFHLVDRGLDGHAIAERVHENQGFCEWVCRSASSAQKRVAIATYASVGQRTLTIAPDKAPARSTAVIVIRPRQEGSGLKYTIPATALAKLGPMSKNLDPRGRYDAVMAAYDLFVVETIP
jgi:hypothetical protein